MTTLEYFKIKIECITMNCYWPIYFYDKKIVDKYDMSINDCISV
jgi:hypothetical protein